AHSAGKSLFRRYFFERGGVSLWTLRELHSYGEPWCQLLAIRRAVFNCGTSHLRSVARRNRTASSSLSVGSAVTKPRGSALVRAACPVSRDPYCSISHISIPLLPATDRARSE